MGVLGEEGIGLKDQTRHDGIKLRVEGSLGPRRRRLKGRRALVRDLVQPAQPLIGALDAARRVKLQRKVDGRQQVVTERPRALAQGHIGVALARRQRRLTGIATWRRLARHQKVIGRPQRIEIAGKVLRRARRIEFRGRIAVLDSRNGRRDRLGVDRTGPRRPEVDQRDPVGIVDADIVGRDVAMQDSVGMDVPDRLQNLAQGGFQKGRADALGGVLQHGDQVHALDIIQRHIGRVVLFENLVNGHDERVLQRGHAARLADELLLQLGKLRLGHGRDGAHLAIHALTDAVGVAFLDHDMPLQAVARHIGDAEPALLQLVQKDVLPVQKPGSGGKLDRGGFGKCYHLVHP